MYIHISSKISGTYNSALQAAAATSAGCSVEVIDSGQASMGLGLVVLAAAAAARMGAGLDEVISAARNAVGRAQCLCLFETLEYLQKGGRLGRAQALVGSVLKIKPMMIVRDGEVHPLGKARTFPRALAKMKQTAREFAPIESLAVMHSTTPQFAEEIADELADMLPGDTEPHVTRFGPALGVYAGPGAIGIALLQAGGGGGGRCCLGGISALLNRSAVALHHRQQAFLTLAGRLPQGAADAGQVFTDRVFG